MTLKVVDVHLQRSHILYFFLKKEFLLFSVFKLYRNSPNVTVISIFLRTCANSKKFELIRD